MVFVVGNKNDLYEEEKIKKEDAEKYAKSINATYRCVSALEGKGIDELFDCVARSFFKREEKGEDEEEEFDPDDFHPLTREELMTEGGRYFEEE